VCFLGKYRTIVSLDRRDNLALLDELDLSGCGGVEPARDDEGELHALGYQRTRYGV